MSNPFFSALLLALEAQHVIELRLVRLAKGGALGWWAEASIMVGEKVIAAAEATSTLMLGGSCEAVIERYRELVRANANRLAAN